MTLRAIYRPSLVFDGRRVPGLDEDEATMAVAAARFLLSTRQIPRASIERLECVGRTASSWANHVRIALGVEHVDTAETSSDAVVRPGFLRIASRGDPGAENVAVAEMAGGGKELDASRRTPRAIDAAEFERLRAAETKALAQLPMGAYVPKATWDATLEARYRLVAGFCPACRQGHHPRLEPCPVCGGPTEVRELAGPGSLYTFTAIAAGGGPSEFDPLQETEGTYGVGIVDFGDAIRVAGLLTETDLATVAIGQRMEPVFRRIYAQEGSWRYGTKFRPVKSA